jgi:hypothetical protein
MGRFFEVDMGDASDLVEMITNYQGDAEKAINRVLLNAGAEQIKKDINIYMPRSDRKLTKSHTRHAKDMSKNLRQEAVTGQQLAVRIRSMPKTQYLYFPDDGSNTKRHAGQQHFMYKGAVKARERVIELCMGELAEI